MAFVAPVNTPDVAMTLPVSSRLTPPKRVNEKLAFAWADWANGSSPRLRVAVTAASTATPALRIPGIPCLMQPPEALGGCSSVSTD